MTRLHGAAPVFVVADVLRSVEYYRDMLGFHTEFLCGQPTFYAGVERDNVLIHLQAAHESRRQPGQAAVNVFVADVDALCMRDFNAADLDGNELCFGMESKR